MAEAARDLRTAERGHRGREELHDLGGVPSAAAKTDREVEALARKVDANAAVVAR